MQAGFSIPLDLGKLPTHSETTSPSAQHGQWVPSYGTVVSIKLYGTTISMLQHHLGLAKTQIARPYSQSFWWGLRAFISPASAGSFFTTSATWEAQKLSFLTSSQGFLDSPVVENPPANAEHMSFNSWPGKILQAQGCWAFILLLLKAVRPRVHALPWEKPQEWKAHLSQLERVHTQQWRPSPVKEK